MEYIDSENLVIGLDKEKYDQIEYHENDDSDINGNKVDKVSSPKNNRKGNVVSFINVSKIDHYSNVNLSNGNKNRNINRNGNKTNKKNAEFRNEE